MHVGSLCHYVVFVFRFFFFVFLFLKSGIAHTLPLVTNRACRRPGSQSAERRLAGKTQNAKQIHHVCQEIINLSLGPKCGGVHEALAGRAGTSAFCRTDVGVLGGETTRQRFQTNICLDERNAVRAGCTAYWPYVATQ